MVDSNMADFYDRVIRFERMRNQGFGFEAQGALGRAHYQPKVKPKQNWLGTAFLVVLVVFVMKAGIFYGVGSESYLDRVDRLVSGEGIDRVGGYLMQADPVTVWMADRIAAGVVLLN